MPPDLMVTLRPVSPEDEAFLRRVYASSREEELAMMQWSPEQRAPFLAMQFEAQRTDYARRFPRAEHAVVEHDGSPVGRIWVNIDSEEIRLLDITILAGARGHGIGSFVLRGLQDRAAATRLPLRHTVVTTNLKAQRLYRRLGFSELDRTETHILMEWRAG